MISAIEARKATKAPSTPTGRISKRKASQNGKKSKKARKSKPFESSNGWNGIIAQRMPTSHDLLNEQLQDTVIMDPGRDMEMSELSDGGDAVWSGHDRPPSAGRPNSLPDDSSGDDDHNTHGEGIQLEALLPQLSVRLNDRATVLSNFEPAAGRNIFIVSGEECASLGVTGPGTLVCLTTEDTVCLLGIFRLIVLWGSLDLLGNELAASKTAHRVYAPRCSPLPIIKPGQGQNSASIPGDQKIPYRLRGIFGFTTVVMFQPLETGVEGLGRICHPFDGIFEPSRSQRVSTSSALDVSGLHIVPNSAKELHPFILPSTWSSALDTSIFVERGRISNPDLPGVYIVKGPKNHGKSTFARTLVNRLLNLYTRVAFLECDIGQPEFTPPGMVSLNVISQPIFGPPFTHPTLPTQAHFIGSSTPRSSPSRYIEAISALIETYRREIQTPECHLVGPSPDSSETKIVDIIPLVVNTMGWVKGLGADINQQIENTLHPTDIFEIRSASHETQGDPRGFTSTLWAQGSSWSSNSYGPNNPLEDCTARKHILEPASACFTTAAVTAADHRNITFLSYFHAMFPRHVIPGPLEQITAHQWDVSRPLCAMPPFEVDCSTAFDKIILTGPGSEDVVGDEVFRALNGAVVGLVVCGHDSRSLGSPYTRGCEPPSPLSSNCIGLAVVRAVSSFNGVDKSSSSSSSSPTPTYLHSLTPVPYPLLSQSRVLVKGELELPLWAMLDFRTFFRNGQDIGEIAGVEPENVPYLQWGKASQRVLGAEKRKIRRNLMRRGQL